MVAPLCTWHTKELAEYPVSDSDLRVETLSDRKSIGIHPIKVQPFTGLRFLGAKRLLYNNVYKTKNDLILNYLLHSGSDLI